MSDSKPCYRRRWPRTLRTPTSLQVLGEEVASKAAKSITMRTSLAHFPFVKSLEAFDFAY